MRNSSQDRSPRPFRASSGLSHLVPIFASCLLTAGLYSASFFLPSATAREPVGFIRRAPEIRYKVVEIVSQDGKPIFANRLSPNGQFVTGTQGDSVLFWHQGKVQLIFKGEANVPWAVNSHGVAAGSIWSRHDSDHAAKWAEGARKVLFDGNDSSYARAIDDAGTIYGGRYHRTSKGIWEGFIHHPNGSTQWIEGRDGFQCVVATASEAGRVCVSLFKEANSPRFYALFSEGKFTPLPPTSGGEKATVLSLNAHETAVGGEVVGTRTVPVRWRSGKPEILPNVPENGSAIAMGINNAGDIVGFLAREPDRKERSAFLYRKGVFTKLDECLDRSGVKLDIPFGISNGGLILSHAVISGRATSVLLIPEK